jgi:hypothetical protein
MANQRDHWIELRGGLLLLTEELTPSLDKKNVELTHDFIENREFGVALEWLNSLIIERSILLTISNQELISKLAHLMDIKLSSERGQGEP